MLPTVAAGTSGSAEEKVDLIEERNKEGGRMESAEAAREKGNGWEPKIGQIKPQTKDFLSPHEISVA